MRQRKQTDRYIAQPAPTTSTRKSTKETASVENVAPEGKKPRAPRKQAKGKAASSDSGKGKGKGKGKAREQDISGEEESTLKLFRTQV